MSKDWYAALFAVDGSKPNELMLIPATDASAMQEAIGDEFEFLELDGWLAYSATSELIGQLKECVAGDRPGISTLFDERIRKELNAGHVAVFVNARQLQETYADELTNADEQLDELVDLMASQVPTANGGPNLQSVWDAYRDMGRVAIQALKDKDQSIRQQAINDLGEIGPKAKAAVPGLVRTFSDGHPGDRFLVARTLGQIGRDAKEAIPVITIALQDDDENLQRVAAEASKKITK